MIRITPRHGLVAPLVALGLLLPAPASLAQIGSQAAPHFEEFGRRFLSDLHATGEQVAATALARWIVNSRADALAAGVQPIPPAIRAQLEGHVPGALLDKVRYRVGSGHEFSLHTNAFEIGTAAAITLDDVVLFRSPEDAASNVNLWAHELHHVRQYEHWGIAGFAQRYTRDHRAVEAEAEEEAARVGAAMRLAASSAAR